MEPITTALLVNLIWENFGQSILDSAKNKYGDKVLAGIEKIISLKEKDTEAIEVEILEAVDKGQLTDKDSLMQLFENSEVVKQILLDFNYPKNVTTTHSLQMIKDSSIKVSGDNKQIHNSFQNISNSTIEIS